MDGNEQDITEPARTDANTPRRALPSWAWAVLGVALGAAVIGGAWLAYESGRSAGLAQRGGTEEATVTPAARITTATPVVVTPPSEATGAAEDPQGSKTPAPSAPATKTPGGIQLGNTLALQHDLNLTKTWKTVYMTSGGGGSWSGPLFPLAKGQIRLKFKVVSGDNTHLWFGLGHIVPSKGIAWMWGTEHATNQDITTQPMAVDAGEYRIETLGTSNWELSLQQ